MEDTNLSIIVSLIIGLLTISGNVLLGLLQRRKIKSEAKKTDVEAYTELVDTITKKTESDFNIMKLLNEQLVKQISSLESQIEVLKKEKLELEGRLDNYEIKERENKNNA